MERCFIGFTASTLVLVAVVAGILFWEVLFSHWPPDVVYAYALAVMNLNLFNDAIESPFYTTRFHREALEKGWFEPYAGFLREFNRYREAHGRDGRLLGDIRWAAIAWTIYYGLLVLSILLPLAWYQFVGHFAFVAFVAVNIPIALLFFFLFGRRLHAEFRTAEGRSFRLLELRPRRRRMRA